MHVSPHHNVPFGAQLDSPNSLWCALGRISLPGFADRGDGLKRMYDLKGTEEARRVGPGKAVGKDEDLHDTVSSLKLSEADAAAIAQEMNGSKLY